MINIIIRADASHTIGTGHIMRCLTLAHELHDHIHENMPEKSAITFICRELSPFLKKKITSSPFELIELKNDKNSTEWNQEWDAEQCKKLLLKRPKVNLLIQDHYQLNKPWQILLQPYYHKLLVIDDLANRNHQTSFLLDQTFGRTAQDYKPWINETCHLLTGSQFILLRKEFIELIATAKIKRQQTAKVAHILLSLGGMDPENISEIIINTLIKFTENNRATESLTLTIVMNSAALHLSKIKKIIKAYDWINIHIDSDNMSGLMLEADIAIGASGTSAWERCSLGLPTLSVQLAENQALVSHNLAKHGAIINLGLGSELTPSKIINKLMLLIEDNVIYQKMSAQSFQCCDGKGASRISTKLLPLHKVSKTKQLELILATMSDCEVIYQWQSNKAVRKYFKQPTPPTWEEHLTWFNNNISASNSMLYVINSYGTAAGVLRLDQQHESEYTLSILIEPNYQGKGLALLALNQLPILIGNGLFFADIHINNSNSQRVFLKAGFTAMSPTRYCLEVKAHEKVLVKSHTNLAGDL